MDAFVSGSSPAAARPASASAAGAQPPEQAYDKACENMWELVSTFLVVHIYHNAHQAALAENTRVQDRRITLADHFQSILAASEGILANDPGRFNLLWRQFYDYARAQVPAMRRDTEMSFLARVAQAYTPLEHLKTMGAGDMQNFTHNAFKAVAIKAYELSRVSYVAAVLDRDTAAVDEMRDRFNEFSRAQRLAIGASLSRRGHVDIDTPYDNAARHIAELTRALRAAAKENEALKASLAAANRRDELARAESTKHTETLVSHAKEQLAARRQLASENSRLRRELSTARSAVASLRDDAQTLLNVARAAQYAASEYEVTPDDSVSVRGDRPLPGRSGGAAAEDASTGGDEGDGEPQEPTPAPPGSPPAREAPASGPPTSVEDLLSGFDAASQSQFERDFS